MNIIASSGGVVVIGPILILIFAVFIGYMAFKINKLSQVLLCVSCVGAIMCIMEGVRLLDRGHEFLPIAGAILIATGLGVMVTIGVTLRSTESKKNEANKSLHPTVNRSRLHKISHTQFTG